MVSNIDISEAAPTLFAHGAALVVPGEFAGRDREKAELVDGVLGSPPGLVLILSEPVGAGKTSLLRMTRSAFVANGLILEDDPRPIWSIRHLDRDALEVDGRRLLLLDEFDRKTSREVLLDKLAIVGMFTDQVPHIILVGDQSVGDHPELRGALGGATIRWVRLDPLGPELLIEALEKRAGYYSLPFDPADIRGILDPEFLLRLLPPTEPPVATFREVLKILTDLAQALPLNNKACTISGETVERLYVRHPPATDDPDQVEFLLGLRSLIRNEETLDTRNALGTAQWRELIPVRGISTDAEYEEQILDPLARTHLLVGLGIPGRDGTGKPRRDPPPYLPSITAVLRSHYDKDFP